MSYPDELSPLLDPMIVLAAKLMFQLQISTISSGMPRFIGNRHNRVVAEFTSATAINNLVVVPEANKVFLGAVNHIYSISLSNLSLVEDAITGPLLDSPMCNTELTSCIGPTGRGSIVETDNWNKILHYVRALPDSPSIGTPNASESGVLLACGSTRQGVCHLRDARQLSRTKVTHPNFAVIQHTSVAANSPNASTVSLLLSSSTAEGDSSPITPDRLYVAASATASSPYRDSFPAVATRLGPAGLLPIHAGSIDGEAAVYMRGVPSVPHVHYVAAFRDERYVYWAAVQNKHMAYASQQAQHMANTGAGGHSLSNPLVTRLIRVCQDDDKYMSYSEIEIQCRSGNGDNTNFNVLKSIVLLKDDLIGVFTDTEGRQSAICIFHMPKIRLTFWYNIDRCRAGTDTIGLPHIGRDSKCVNKSHLALSEDTCQLGVGGTIEASQLAAEQYTTNNAAQARVLTAVDARIVDDRHAIVIVGTAAGEIIQMEMTGNQHNRRLEKYAEYAVGSGGQAVDKIQFLDDKRFLAVANKEVPFPYAKIRVRPQKWQSAERVVNYLAILISQTASFLSLDDDDLFFSLSHFVPQCRRYGLCISAVSLFLYSLALLPFLLQLFDGFVFALLWKLISQMGHKKSLSLTERFGNPKKEKKSTKWLPAVSIGIVWEMAEETGRANRCR
ncbi:sema domain-containing protein [Ditylenchus destructor]|nr:sema domain-containing protein [Ditylenchus destructor]